MLGPPYNAWAERLSDRPLCAQVCERPLMFLLDTPGVLAPRIQSVEMGLKLALCGKWGGFEGGRQAWNGGLPFLDVAIADASGLCWASRPSSLCGPSSQQSRARHRSDSRSPWPGEHLPFSVYCRGRAVRPGALESRCWAGFQSSHWPPGPRNRVGPPCRGGDPGRLPSLHPQQAPALWVSAGCGAAAGPLSPPVQM